MKKWFSLLIITIILCFITQNSTNAQELATIAVVGFGIEMIISEIKKPISH